MRLALNGATTMPYPLQQDISVAAKVGFEGLEIWWGKLKTYLKNNSATDLKELLTKHQVEPIDICPLMIGPFRNTELTHQSFDQALEVARIIGCSAFLIFPDARPPHLTQQKAFSMLAEELAYLAEKVRNDNIRLTVEPIGGHSLVPGPREALELIQLAGSSSNVGLMMDTFHYFKSEVSDEDIKAVPLEKLDLVHINDCEDRPIEELKDEHRLYPTLGIIPLKHTLSILREKGYEGYLSLEIFRPSYWKQQPMEIAVQGYRYLKKLLLTL